MTVKMIIETKRYFKAKAILNLKKNNWKTKSTMKNQEKIIEN